MNLQYMKYHLNPVTVCLEHLIDFSMQLTFLLSCVDIMMCYLCDMALILSFSGLL